MESHLSTGNGCLILPREYGVRENNDYIRETHITIIIIIKSMKDYFNLKGRVAIVTGCSGGLGVQMARALASAGCNIVPIARRMEKLEEVAAALRADFGVEALPLRCDITSTEQVDEVVDKALEHFGRIDILVNNAGTGAVAPAEAITDAQFENEMQIDLFGSFRVARAVAAKAMIPAGFGRIINIASMYGLVGNKIAPASPYHAAKGGVVNLSRALAAEWGKYGITVNSICPGYFYTPLTVETLNSDYFQDYAKRVIPLERYGDEGELDTATLFLASPASSYVTGVALPVDGGYTCV
jgi:gluconate 5-dehydrogenase